MHTTRHLLIWDYLESVVTEGIPPWFSPDVTFALVEWMFRTCDVKCSCACSHLVSPGGAAGVLSGVAVAAEVAVPTLLVLDSRIC